MPADLRPAHAGGSGDAGRDFGDRTTSVARTAFSELGLPTPLLRALRGIGYHTATDIQAAAIPALLAGRDVIGVAQTGTGKTAAYGLPLLAAVDTAQPGVQALVLVPTRELAVQVCAALDGFAAHLPDVATIAIYGGASMGKQIGALRRGAQVVVGTPGRVIDLMERGSLRLDSVRFAVLDEADEMLRMGFAEDVDRILDGVPAARQTALFSATMPGQIRRVAAQHLQQPVDVSVAASATPVVGIDQSFAVLPYREKTAALERVLSISDAPAAVVFVRTRSACEEVGAALIGGGLNAAVISGDVNQAERERTIERLRSGAVDVLVATDVAARGMDVERIGLVVNFDAPNDPEIYTHRIGRTGRAGRTGQALTFFTPKETSRRKFIERATGVRMAEIAVPSADEVRTHRAARILAAAVDRHAAGGLQNYRGALREVASRSGLPAEEIAAALLATVLGDDGTMPAWTAEQTSSSDRRSSATGRRAVPDRRSAAGRAAGSSRASAAGGPAAESRRMRPEDRPGTARRGQSDRRTRNDRRWARPEFFDRAGSGARRGFGPRAARGSDRSDHARRGDRSASRNRGGADYRAPKRGAGTDRAAGTDRRGATGTREAGAFDGGRPRKARTQRHTRTGS